MKRKKPNLNNKLKPGMTKDEHYKNLSYQEQISIIYLWDELNGLEYLRIEPEHNRKLKPTCIKAIKKLNPKKNHITNSLYA